MPTNQTSRGVDAVLHALGHTAGSPQARMARHQYEKTMRMTGDPRLAAQAAQTVQAPTGRPQMDVGRVTGTSSFVDAAMPDGQMPPPRVPEARAVNQPTLVDDLRTFRDQAAYEVPVVGDALTAKDAIVDALRGNYGAALPAAFAAIPLVPGSIGKRMGSWVKGKKNLESLDRLSRDRPFGAPPSYNAGFSQEKLDQLAKTQARRHQVDPDKPMPLFVPDGRGRLVNSRGMSNADDAVAGIQSGSNVSGKPPSKPKPDRSPSFAAPKKKALAQKAYNNSYLPKGNGKTPVTIEDAKKLAPGVPDDKLQKAVDYLNTTVKSLKRGLSEKQFLDLVMKKLSVVGAGGAGAALVTQKLLEAEGD